MVRRATKNYILGIWTSPRGLKNMYKYGASITTTVKLMLAFLGLYGGISSGSSVAGRALIRAVVGSLIPFYLALDGTFIGWVDTFLTLGFLILTGTLVAAGKYDLATRGRY